jgi:hypothetical protein
MSADDFYWYASVLIFLPWLLLIALPNWRYTEPIAFGAAFLLLAVAAWFTFMYLASGGAEGSSVFSLDGLTNLFRSKQMLLTGWLNYLSFCLLVGIWQVHDARQAQIPHWLLIAPLLVTLVAGPVGVLLYLLLRFFKTRRWEVK